MTSVAIFRPADCHPGRVHLAKGLCDSCYRIQWRKNHCAPGSVLASKRHESKRRSERKRNIEKFGISIADFEARLAAQGGGCAICGRVKDAWRQRLSIDHDHVTNAVRGILCNRCNSGVGFLDKPDSAEWLEKAMAYLRRSAN